MSDNREEMTFLIPRRVKTEWEFFGMRKRHLIRVVPWGVAAALVYYTGGAQSTLLQLGVPTLLLLIGYGLFGWAGGEDDQTAWDLLQRWWRSERTQSLYLYRKERMPCQPSKINCNNPSPGSSSDSPQACGPMYRGR